VALLLFCSAKFWRTSSAATTASLQRSIASRVRRALAPIRNELVANADQIKPPCGSDKTASAARGAL
jgi:hypothetical protein